LLQQLTSILIPDESIRFVCQLTENKKRNHEILQNALKQFIVERKIVSCIESNVNDPPKKAGL